jgi:hypothetical protein
VLDRAIFDMLRCLSPDYGGGLWEYYQLSNGGFYMAPAGNGMYTIIYEGIGFSGNVSAQAAGIIACAIAFSHLSHLVKGDGCVRAYELLMDFIAQHPEAKVIRSALD